MEVRTILYWSTLVSCLSGLCSVVFANRWNVALGIPDIAWIICTDTIFGVVSLAMNTLPTLALFAKITPHRIEGTIFAFLTGTLNLANIVVSPMVGVAVNQKFVGVTADDLSGYNKLCLINFGMSFLALPMLYMVPLREDIDRWQAARKSEVSREEKVEEPVDGVTPKEKGEVVESSRSETMNDTENEEAEPLL